MHDHGQDHDRGQEPERGPEHEPGTGHEHHQRQDIEHWLAAAAPEEVPVLVDLHHRARALGRRRRTRRRLLAAGGAGVTTAAVVAAVFAVGHPSAGVTPGPTTATSSPTTSTTAMPSKPLSTYPGSPLEDDRPTAQAAIKAFEAALPAGSKVTNAKAFVNDPRAKFTGSVFGIMLDVAEPDGRSYSLQVNVSNDPYGEAWDCDSPIHCGDSQFLGHAVHWQSVPALKPDSTGRTWTTFNVRDPATDYNFGYQASNKNIAALPLYDEFKTIALNEKLGEALVAAYKQAP